MLTTTCRSGLYLRISFLLYESIRIQFIKNNKNDIIICYIILL